MAVTVENFKGYEIEIRSEGQHNPHWVARVREPGSAVYDPPFFEADTENTVRAMAQAYIDRKIGAG